MLGFEVFEVVLVVHVVLGLLVLGKLRVVVIFHGLASAFVCCLVIGSEYLPSLANGFGNLGEAQIFPLEMLSHFYKDCQLVRHVDSVSSLTVGEEHVC
jgi:hypothetical protein